MFDAVVVGTGATGSWAAKVLAENGLSVLVLDGGPNRHTKPAGLNAADLATRRVRQPVQSQHYAWPADPDSFVDDVDCPYSTTTSFQWIRSRQVGGRMVVPGHGHRFLRMSDHEFHAAQSDGFGESWPLGLQELSRHYDRVEETIRFEDHQGDQASRWLQQTFPDRGQNWRFRTDGVGLPPQPLAAALATGRVVLHDNTIVSHVLVDAQKRRAAGVACVDRLSLASKEFLAKRVLLCASAIESTRILMNSGLANSSGLLGTHLMDHVSTSIVARYRVGRLRGLLHRAAGRAYLGPFGDSRAPRRFLRSFGIQVWVGPATDGYRQVGLDAFGEMLPRIENRVSLQPAQVDRWGIPTVDICCAHSDNELAMAEHQLQTMRTLAAHADDITVRPENRDGLPRPPGRVNHEAGTARMGRSRATAVLKPNNETWDVEKLYVLDAACFVTQGHQNPTLTMLAIADRACLAMVERPD
jgi:choline dehydrogenase-like flavoprotein